jgi:hypothetical protein
MCASISHIFATTKLKIVLFSHLPKQAVFKLLEPLLPFLTQKNPKLIILCESGNIRTVKPQSVIRRWRSNTSLYGKKNSPNKKLWDLNLRQESSFTEEQSE